MFDVRKLHCSLGAALGIGLLVNLALPVAAHAEVRGGPVGTVFCPPDHIFVYGGNSGKSLESAKSECRELGLPATVRPGVISATLAPDRPRDTFVSQADAATGVSAVDASAVSQNQPGRPADPVPPSDNIPVLNCSNSSNNPPHVDLSTGQPGWTLNGPAGAVGIAPASNVSWSAVAGAQWIGPAAPSAVGLYTYTTRVRFNACPKGRPAQIAVTYRADNIGTLFVNGVPSQTQAGTYNYGFLPASQTTKTVVFPTGTSGVQIIELRVQNTSSWTGLAANIQVTR